MNAPHNHVLLNYAGRSVLTKKRLFHESNPVNDSGVCRIALDPSKDAVKLPAVFMGYSGGLMLHKKRIHGPFRMVRFVTPGIGGVPMVELGPDSPQKLEAVR